MKYLLGRFIVFYDDDREMLNIQNSRARLSQARYDIYLREDRKPSVLIHPKAVNGN